MATAANYPGFTAWPQEDLFIFTLALAQRQKQSPPVTMDEVIAPWRLTREQIRMSAEYVAICMLSQYKCPTDGGPLYWDPYGKFLCSVSGKLVDYTDQEGSMVPVGHE